MSQKSTDNTVFVRFVPPSSNIRRHHLEDIFSEIGPIKKSSVIHTKKEEKSSSYGFVKFVTPTDAMHAEKMLNNRTLKVSDNESVKIKVERASTVTKQKSDPEDLVTLQKKRCRLIIRNLSFYAKEPHIIKAMEMFGPVVEVHIPKIGSTARGFGFVTFEKEKDANKCLQAKEPIVIANRTVEVSYSLNKTIYESQKNGKRGKTDEKPNQESSKKLNVKEEAALESKENHDEEDDQHEEDNTIDSDSSASEENDVDMDMDEDVASEADKREEEKEGGRDDTAIAEKRALFIRNLPFDATRQDLFQLFVKYGYINGVFLVKDSETSLPKGTAFVIYRDAMSADKALEASKSENNFVSQKQTTGLEDSNGNPAFDSGIVLNGRRLLVDVAVDKSTASTLAIDKTSVSKGKDRRNLYLKGEGRVDNDVNEERNAWDELPESDQLKRQRAWSDKNTKLRSPLFFINPTRLSIRNLAKHINESDLKMLCVEATKKGLAKNLVTVEDQVAHWKALGEMSTRDILARLQHGENTGVEEAIIPDFDDKNVKKSIPSVFIDRDFTTLKKNDKPPSRGFGFVEFEHHVHALACLRELNNNPLYTSEYVQNGKQTINKKKKAGKKDAVPRDGIMKLPRLIVEFTVENKAKAKKQAEHRAAQQANLIKQKKENRKQHEHLQGEKHKESRGARQRERKRERKEGEGPEVFQADPNGYKEKESDFIEMKVDVKPIKPPKRKRVDKEEEHFSKLVASYKKVFERSDTSPEATKKTTKRWFDDV